MTHPITSTESNDVIADPPLVLASDGIKSIYVNWQGPPLSDGVSGSGPVVRSVLTGRNESISAIARAEIGNPDYAVKFSPMSKGHARLEVARVTPAICAGPATALPVPRKRRPSISKMIAQAEKATGKPVTSITMPDGTKFDFSKATDATADDEVENWLRKQKGH
jgi:hypothetical protein